MLLELKFIFLLLFLWIYPLEFEKERDWKRKNSKDLQSWFSRE